MFKDFDVFGPLMVEKGNASNVNGRDSSPCNEEATDKLLSAMLELDATLAARFKGSTTGLKDPSRSEMDFSLTSLLKWRDFDRAQIDYIIRSRFEYGRGAEATEDYLRRNYEKATGPGIDRTDAGNAERFALRYSNDLFYVEAMKMWFHWDGKRWNPRKTGISTLAMQVAKDIAKEAACLDAKKKKEMVAWSKTSQSNSHVNAMHKLAEGYLLKDASVIDSHPMLLNLSNGVLDLQTGKLGPHDPALHLSKSLNIDFDPDAKCPQFLGFLNQVTQGSEDEIDFLQRWFGYCLTASVAEQCLLILVGSGANGKSTLLELFCKLLGQYAIKTPGTSLRLKKNDSVPTDIADLKGKRLAVSSEATQGRALDESVVKELTGGDTVSARKMRQDYIEFPATHKFVLAVNDMPKISGVGEGIWRRIKVIRFNFIANNPDKHLKEKLETELPGILNWALEGCLEWQRRGELGDPQTVIEETQQFREDCDPVQKFLNARTEKGNEDDPRYSVPVGRLYDEYENALDDLDLTPMTKTAFGINMRDRGFPSKPKKVKGKTVKMYCGLRLKAKQPCSIFAIDHYPAAAEEFDVIPAILN